MFDIIIPTYNTPENLLLECLNGIQRQRIDHSLINAILINDAGRAIDVDGIKPLYDFQISYYVNEINVGPGICRQLGIEKASDWIVFCDADDVLSKDALLQYFNLIRQDKNIDIIYPAQINLLDEFLVQQTVPNNFPDGLYAVCINKRFLTQHPDIKFLPYYYHEDGLFTMQCAIHNPRIVCANGEIIAHRIGRYESLATFKNTAIYDLSLIVSAYAIYHHFLNEQEQLYLCNDQRNFYIEMLLSRLTFSDALENKDNKVFIDLLSFFITCIKRALPYEIVEYFIKNFDQTIFNCDIEEYYSSNFLNDLTQFCENDNQTIFTYLSQMGKLAFETYVKLNNIILPECTITIPTYNNSKQQIERVLNHFSRQSAVKYINILIIDDGSTNNELSLVEYPENLKIQIIRSKFNKGVGRARQIGLDNVHTPYVMFFDMDDDIIYDDIVWHYLAFLMTHPDYTGIRGKEIWRNPTQNDELQEDISLNSLHGLCCKVDTLREYGIKFKPWQYAEDGMFTCTILLYGLKIKSLKKETFYFRDRGYLTENIESTIGNLNFATDSCLIIRALLEIMNSTKANSEIIDNCKDCLINEVQNLSNSLFPYGKDEDLDTIKTQFLRDHVIDPRIKNILSIYYLYEAVRIIPFAILRTIKQQPWAWENSSLIMVIDNLLANDDCYYIKMASGTENKIYTIDGLEKETIEWFHDYLDYCKNLQQECKDLTINLPIQAIKHQPWNYKTYQWKGRN